jgi:hypothetical protein
LIAKEERDLQFPLPHRLSMTRVFKCSTAAFQPANGVLKCEMDEPNWAGSMSISQMQKVRTETYLGESLWILLSTIAISNKHLLHGNVPKKMEETLFSRSTWGTWTTCHRMCTPDLRGRSHFLKFYTQRNRRKSYILLETVARLKRLLHRFDGDSFQSLIMKNPETWNGDGDLLKYCSMGDRE